MLSWKNIPCRPKVFVEIALFMQNFKMAAKNGGFGMSFGKKWLVNVCINVYDKWVFAF